MEELEKFTTLPHFREDHMSSYSIPEWAQKSLRDHAQDDRIQYSFDDLENARTDDEGMECSSARVAEFWTHSQLPQNGVGEAHTRVGP